MRELDPDGIPIPMMLPAVTDARHLCRWASRLRLHPPEAARDFPLTTLAHAADERVPADAVRFGAEAIYRAVQRYPG